MRDSAAARISSDLTGIAESVTTSDIAPSLDDGYDLTDSLDQHRHLRAALGQRGAPLRLGGPGGDRLVSAGVRATVRPDHWPCSGSDDCILSANDRSRSLARLVDGGRRPAGGTRETRNRVAWGVAW